MGLSVAVRFRGTVVVEVAVEAGTRGDVPDEVSDYIKHIIFINQKQYDEILTLPQMLNIMILELLKNILGACLCTSYEASQFFYI